MGDPADWKYSPEYGLCNCQKINNKTLSTTLRGVTRHSIFPTADNNKVDIALAQVAIVMTTQPATRAS